MDRCSTSGVWCMHFKYSSSYSWWTFTSFPTCLLSLHTSQLHRGTGAVGLNDFIPDIKNTSFMSTISMVNKKMESFHTSSSKIRSSLFHHSLLWQLSVWILGLFFLLTILLILNRICKKLKVIEKHAWRILLQRSS
jgi:hypothetical protein